MEEIKKSLTEISDRKGIRILFACETGSRAWGFPSPDSDYDIRFIYMHEMDWYLSLSQRKDTIEWMEGDLDITGWDLKKSLNLLKKSNTALIERFQSPIEYISTPGFKEQLMSLVEMYYSPTAVFYHHYSLARKFWDELKGMKEIRLKSYCYLLRSLLSCYWISRDPSVPPMHIEGLMTKIDDETRENLRKLIRLKSTVDEKYMYKREKELDSWVQSVFESMEQEKNGLGTNKTTSEALNAFFLKMVK